MSGLARLRSWPLEKLERLIVAAGVACATIVVVATIAHALQLRDAIQSAAEGRLTTVARILAREVDRTLAQTRGLLDQVDDALQGGVASPEALVTLLESMPRQQTLLREIAIVDRDGRVVASSEPDRAGLDVSRYPFAGEPGTGRLHVGPPMPGRGLSAPQAATDVRAASRTPALDGHLTLSRAVERDAWGRGTIAVVGSASLIGALRFLSGDEQLRIAVYRYDGRLLAASDPAATSRSTPHPVFSDFLPQRETGGFADRPGDGRAWRVHFDTTADFPVVVEVRMPQSAITAQWERELGSPLLILAVTLIALALFARTSTHALRQRVRSEARAATQERRLRNILETAADGIVTIDGRGVVREYNRAAETIFGVPAAQAIGRPMAALLPEEHAHDHQAHVERYLGGGRGSVIGRGRTIRSRRPDGSPMELHLAVSEVVVQGERLFTGIVRDVTERERQERALREARDAAESAAAAKAQFLAMMSHELRTPMTGIIGMIDLLSETRITDEQQRFVDVLRGSAQSLLTVLNDVLDYSKIEAGRLHLERIDFRPEVVVREVVDLLSHAASQRGNNLDVKCSGGLPALSGDPTRLRQVLFNLVGNAIKFTERGTITICGGTRALEDGRVALAFEVRDTGVGIAPDVLPTLFRPFQQADSSTTRRFGGTGLGLAICRHLVEAMDGEIGVDSVPGEGSTFHFLVRLAPARGEPAAPVPDAAPQPPAVRGLRVLVAEDNPTNRLLVGTRLRRASHQVDLVENGLQALSAVRDGDYDVVLMDMQMPELDGVGATRAIRALPGPRSRTPIVALTADALPEFRERYMSSGLDDYLTKPIDWQALERVLRRFAPARPHATDAAATAPPGPRAAVPSSPPPPAGAAMDPNAYPTAPATHGVATAAPPDAAAVAAMQDDLGEDVWQAVLEIYWPKADADLADCRAAIAAGDPAARRAAAHSLKGASSSLGFDSVARIAATLEHCPADEAAVAIDALGAAFDAVRRAWSTSDAPVDG